MFAYWKKASREMGFQELSLPGSVIPGNQIPENGVGSYYTTMFAFKGDNVIYKFSSALDIDLEILWLSDFITFNINSDVLFRLQTPSS